MSVGTPSDLAGGDGGKFHDPLQITTGRIPFERSISKIVPSPCALARHSFFFDKDHPVVLFASIVWLPRRKSQLRGGLTARPDEVSFAFSVIQSDPQAILP